MIPNAFNALHNDFDEIYMLAAIVGVNRTLKDPHEVIRTNTKLTSNVLDWIAENPVKKVLFLPQVKIMLPQLIYLILKFLLMKMFLFVLRKLHILDGLMLLLKFMVNQHLFTLHKISTMITELLDIRILLVPTWGLGTQFLILLNGLSIKLKIRLRFTGMIKQELFAYIDDAVKGNCRSNGKYRSVK